MADPGAADGSGSAERDRIERVYGAYGNEGRRARWDHEQPGNRAMVSERDSTLATMLRARRIEPATVLDVGCGNGDALANFVERLALPTPPARCVGVDLLGDRLADARDQHGPRAARADATALPFADSSVDLVLCFTVFSSISDEAVRSAIALEISRVLSRGGAVAWYDMRRRSPSNPEVSPIGADGLESLFPRLRVVTQSVTLVPPLARRLGPLTDRAYPALARLPFLRTHLAAVLTPR